MIDERKMVSVTNRSRGGVTYVIPDKGIIREFNFGETKQNIPVEELEQLQWVPGGDYILKNCLLINDTEVLEHLNVETEPEYFYTDEDVRKLLFEGSLDQLEDALNFAPAGVIDLIKKMAVEEEVPDTRKRKMISDKTGFNIESSINLKHMFDDDADGEDAEAQAPGRKAAPIKAKPETPAAPARKYKVVEKK